jgi:hypothetical protein
MKYSFASILSVRHRCEKGEGSGSGYAPMTIASGRPKNLQILRIRSTAKSYLALTKGGKGDNDSQFELFRGVQLVGFSSDLLDIELFFSHTKLEVHFLVNGQAST